MKSVRRNYRKIVIGIAFLLPSFVLYTVFVIYPIFYSNFLSFTNWDGIGKKIFVGLSNYQRTWTHPDFIMVLGNTLMVTGLSMLIQVPSGLIIAFLLFRTKTKVFKVYRAIYFLPVVIASTVVAVMFRILLNNDIGVFSSVLSWFRLGRFNRPWLSDPGTVLYSVIFVQIWQFIGTYVIIFFAALQSIDEEIFESSRIDGANCVQQFFRIACPLVSDILKIAIVFCFNGSMRSYDIPFVMTTGGPGFRSTYLGIYMYRQVFTNANYGRGSVVAVTILLICFTFTILFNKLARQDEDKGLKEKK